jgi:hypothetical protein
MVVEDGCDEEEGDEGMKVWKEEGRKAMALLAGLHPSDSSHAQARFALPLPSFLPSTTTLDHTHTHHILNSSHSFFVSSSWHRKLSAITIAVIKRL